MAHRRDGSYHSARYPPMEGLANAPFDDVMNHLHTFHHHNIHQQQLGLQRAHREAHFQAHNPSSLHNTSHPPRIHSGSTDINAAMQHLHNAHHALHAHNARVQQEFANMMDMHQQVSMMHNVMVQQAESMINDMIGWSVNFPTLPRTGSHEQQQQRHSPFTHMQNMQRQDYTYENLLQLDEGLQKRGVASSDLSKLKRTRYTPRERCKQCGICQENFTLGTKIIALPCAHSYCEHEILKWFEQNRTCPTCRHVIENINSY